MKEDTKELPEHVVRFRKRVFKCLYPACLIVGVGFVTAIDRHNSREFYIGLRWLVMIVGAAVCLCRAIVIAHAAVKRFGGTPDRSGFRLAACLTFDQTNGLAELLLCRLLVSYPVTEVAAGGRGRIGG